MIKIAVLVSGGGTNLQALIDCAEHHALANGKLDFVISSNAEAYALTRAERSGIASAVLRRRILRTVRRMDRRSIPCWNPAASGWLYWLAL